MVSVGDQGDWPNTDPGARTAPGGRCQGRVFRGAPGCPWTADPERVEWAVRLSPLCLLVIFPKKGLEVLIVIGGQQQNPGGVDEAVGEDDQPEV